MTRSYCKTEKLPQAFDLRQYRFRYPEFITPEISILFLCYSIIRLPPNFSRIFRYEIDGELKRNIYILNADYLAVIFVVDIVNKVCIEIHRLACFGIETGKTVALFSHVLGRLNHVVARINEFDALHIICGKEVEIKVKHIQSGFFSRKLE